VAYLALTCHILIGLVFAVSATSKVRSGAAYRDFRAWVASLPLCAGWMAAALMAVEIAIVVLLVAPPTVIAGMWLAALTAAVFAGETVMVIRQRVRVTCHCFGQSDTRIGVAHLVRNVLVLTVAVIGAVAALGRSGAVVTAPGLALCVLGASFSAPFVIYFDDLVALLFPQRFWTGATDGLGGRG
jgi:hypothetical protein